VPDAARRADYHHGLSLERHRLVLVRLKRVGFIVSERNQELPCRQRRHRRTGGVKVIDAGRLDCELGRRDPDKLRAGPAATGQAGRKANH
jgi:hypothetical protein